MPDNAVKLSASVAMLIAWKGHLALLLVFLLFAMFLDYATGLMAAKNRGSSITSYKSISGLCKKGAMLLAVAGCLVLDLVVVFARDVFGLTFQWSFIIAALASVWLIVNEVISVLENVQDIGVEIPHWLLPLAKNIKGKVENLAPKKEDNDHE